MVYSLRKFGVEVGWSQKAQTLITFFPCIAEWCEDQTFFIVEILLYSRILMKCDDGPYRFFFIFRSGITPLHLLF